MVPATQPAIPLQDGKFGRFQIRVQGRGVVYMSISVVKWLR
jgi:hypothetical protein